jgi:Calx-beta domain/FG-GAP repeat
MVPTWLKSLFSRRTIRTKTGRPARPASRPQLVQLEDRAVPAVISIADAKVMEGNAGTTTLMFTVSADAAEAADITFKINTADLTATAGTDYVALTNVSGKIDAGDTTTTVMVTVNGDTTVEADETLKVTLSNLSAGNTFSGGGATESAIGTIENDDTATISFGASPSVAEGGMLNFTVMISNPVDIAVTADQNTVDGSAMAASDYNAVSVTGGTLFAANSVANKTITVTTKGDNLVELDETLSLMLSNLTATRKVVFAGGGATLSKSATITNDDSATISFGASPSSLEESGALTFIVSIDNPVDVDVTADRKTADDTALAASDYTALANANITLFAANSSAAKSIAVTVTPENLVELDETLSLILSNLAASGRKVMFAGGAAMITDTGEITNDDTATVSISSPSVAEGGTLAFIVTIDNPVDAAVTAKRKTADGTAGTSAPSDYTALADSAITLFNANSTASKTINVATSADAIVEANETISLILTQLAATGRTVQFVGGALVTTSAGTGTITNDDTTILTINSRTDSEVAGAVTFTINSTNAVQGGFTVQYKSADGTATSGLGKDYLAATGTESFNGVVNENETFTVTLLNDNVVEADETYILSLFNVVPTNGLIDLSAFDTTDTGTGTITSGDTAEFQITANASANEGDPISFTITLSNQVEATTSVTITTTGGTATNGTDYTDATGMVVTFDPFVTSKTFMVITTEDNVVEANETFNFSIGGLNDGGLVGDVTIDGLQASRVGTINNDDSAQFRITAAASAVEGNNVSFNVTLTNPVDVATSVTVTTADITAQQGAGKDYTKLNGVTVNFGAGDVSKTVMVVTNDDVALEPDQTFSITVGGLNNGGRGTVTIDAANKVGIGTIQDNDGAKLMIDDITQAESGGPMLFTVTLMGEVEDGFTVSFKANNGTATAGDNDFTLAPSTLTFVGTDTETKTISVTINDDNKVEADESFIVELFNVVAVSAPPGSVSVADKGNGTILNDDSALVTISKTASAIEGNKITFTVSLSNPVDVTTTVKVTTADIAPTVGGTDYTTLTDFLVTFNPTVQNQSVMVSTTTDNIVETDETFSISLGSLNNNGRPTVTIDAANSTGTGTITNDDSAVFTIGNASIVEGGMITFTINLSAPVSTDTSVTVTTADVNAIDGVDYTGLVSQLVSFPALSTSQQVTVATKSDTIVEADETFKAILGGLNDGGFPGKVTISGTNGTAIGTITNDDSTMLTIGDVTQAEGAGKMTFTVTLGNGVQGGFTVLVNTANGTATVADSDYGMVSGTKLTFAGTPGETQSFDVNIIDDNKVEADETFTVSTTGAVTLEAGVPAGKITNGTATGKIVNDDAAMFSIQADSSVIEGGMVKFVVLLSNPVDVATSVTVTTTDGSAKTAAAPAFDKDFTALTGTPVLFGANVTSVNVFVPTLADNIVELDELFSIALGGLNNGGRPTVTIDAGNDTRTGTITNDDSTQFKITPTSSASEGGKIGFTVSLTNPVDVPTSVTVTTADGTAMVADNDYNPIMAMTINFAALATSQSFDVTTNDDDVVEADETFTVTLGGLMDGGRIPGTVTIDAANGTGTGTILNNDLASLSIADVAMDEATGMITFTVLLTGDVQGGFTVDIKTADGTAMVSDADYVAGMQTLVFAGNNGETQQFTVMVTDDNKVETDETFTVSLLNVVPNDAKVKASDIGSSDKATGTIRNDDSTTLTIADVSQAEGAGKMTFTVVLSNPVQGGLKVDFATSDGSAKTSDNDYDANSGTLVFAGTANEPQTFMVTVNDDATIEPDELFNLALSNVVTLGAGVMASKVDATDTAVGNILTDDKAEINLFASTDVEGNNLVYTITLSNKISKDVTVDFATLAGVGARPAISGLDFTAVAKTVTFLAGSTKETIVVPLTDDRRVEGSEQFDSQITNIQADASVISALFFGKALDTATIADNDTVSASFTSAGGGAMEDNVAGVTSTVELTVTAVGTGTVGIDRTVVVRVANMGGTATNGVDYKNFTNPTDLTFAKADFTKTSQNIAFDLIEDINKEGDETIVFGISLQTDDTAGQASIGAIPVNTFKIGSDDEVIRTYDASVAGDYTFVSDGSGNVQLFLGPILLSKDAIGTQAILLNGTTGADSATVDYAAGSPVPTDGISFNGNGPAAGERFAVLGGAFTSIVNTFTGAQSATLSLVGAKTDKLAYTNVDAAEIKTAPGTLTIQLPAGASDVILEDDGIAGNGVSQIRSGNGTFATTKFSNPTGTLVVATDNAADTLTINDILDTSSSIVAGSATNRFASITQVGDVSSKGDVRYFANAIAINDGADLTAAKAVELNAANTVALGTTKITASDFSQTGASKVAINAGALATVSGTATINFAGTIDGPGSLTTSGSATSVFQQPIGTGTALANATFGSKIDATATGTPTVTGGTTGGRFNVRANTIALNAALDATGGPVVLRLVNNGGATQSAPITATKLYLEGSGSFTLNNADNQLTGDGKKLADLLMTTGGNTVPSVAQIQAVQALQGDLFVNLSGGSIDVRDKTDLIIRFEDATQNPAIMIGNDAQATLTSGADVSIEDKRAIDPTVLASKVLPLLNVGKGTVQVNVGVDRDNVANYTIADLTAQLTKASTIVRFLAEANAGRVTLGSPPTPTDTLDIRITGTNFTDSANLENIAKDTFTIRPALGAPLTLNGNSPIVNDAVALRPYDTLSPQFAGVGSINLIPMGNGNGTFNFGNGFQPIDFKSIENIGGIQANALVVQTGPSQSTPANNYAIRLNATISGQPFGSALSGNGIVTNPFVVTPSLGGVTQFDAPQISFADVDGDTTPDLIIANGTGDAPLITIVRGSRLFGGNKLNLSALDPTTDIISQFFAFEETFRGGIQVRAADFNGDGKAELAVSPGIGGGPRIIVYQIDQSNPNVFNNAVIYRHVLGTDKAGKAILSNPYNFFPYESTFRGGVNVAVGDVNGDGVPDIIAGAGFGGGPRVRVYDGSIDPTLADGVTVNPNSTIADFFAYDPAFRGGVFVDSGRFDSDTIADLVTAPGPGGSAHIQVFQGRTNAQPFEVDAGRGQEFRVPMVSFFAFEEQPSLTNPQASRTGVGGISFGTSTDNLGSSRSILVTRPEGTKFEIVKFDPVLPGTPLTTDDIANKAVDIPISPTLSLRKTVSFETILALAADKNNPLPFNVLIDGGSAAGSA